MKRSINKRCAEQHIGAVIDVPNKLKSIWVSRSLAENSSCLQDKLVRAEIIALEENKLVLVREI